MPTRKQILIVCLFVSVAMQAQKIDFNLSGKESTSTENGFTSWAVGRVKNASKTIDGIAVKADPVTGTAANGLNNNWWKDGVNKYSKLVSDGVYPASIDSENNYTYSSNKPMGIQFTFSGLSAGEHSLCAYHNNTDGLDLPYPTVMVIVNGDTLQRGVEQTIRQQTIAASGMSYVKFSVKDGEKVVVKYVSEPAEGISYSNTTVAVNALIFDRPNPKTTASEPTPANLDYHADCDGGFAVLSWKGGTSAVKHRLMLGSSPDALQLLAETTGNTYELVTDDYRMTTVYWRIDEIDAAGNIYEGDLWSFRPRHIAFPGAEGYGKYAIGGRGGTVYHVTSLDDDVANPQPGTFRYGIARVDGPRTIVFDVSGYINLKGRLTCSSPYVTVAGQTAPGKGIIFRGAPLGFASDGIIRFIRNHRGYAGTTSGPAAEDQNRGLDGIGLAGVDNAILDHCTIAWTTDEGFSSRNANSLTLQRTIISEALNCADHPNYEPGKLHGFAATIGGGANGGVGSYHHNLLAHCDGRNWSLSGGLDGGGSYAGAHDVFNNVVYNWGSRATDGGTHELNFVNNYYKMGPATTQTLLLRHQFEGTGNGSQAAYVSGNVRENLSGSITKDASGVTYSYELSGGQKLTWSPWATEPFFPSLANIEETQQAYMNVLSDVGCNEPVIDDHDVRIINETLNKSYTFVGSKTGKKGLIDREWDAGGYEDFPELSRDSNWDSDQDGMPDWWETAQGLNPYEPDNNKDDDKDGYTALEDYLNWCAEPHFIVNGSTAISIPLEAYFAGYPANSEFSTTYTETQIGISSSTLVVNGGSESKLISVPVTVRNGTFAFTRTFNIFIDAHNTGIVSITNALPSQRKGTFNIAGQRVSVSYKGIVLRNNRKMIMK